ncbi:NAD(+)/NADH kinase, partial [bacterium]|nr:NAD(+)/NADH kinase [bacterium]
MKHKPIEKVAFFIKPGVPEIYRIGREAVQWLQKQNITTNINPKALKDLKSDTDLAIVLGGDGTILWVARKVAPFEIPVLSFNMGNLGFLAAYSINRLYEVLEKTIEGDFTVAERMMLQS